MERDTRDKIAKEISNEKEIDFFQAQEIVELFLRLTYKEGYIVIKQGNNSCR